MWEQKFKKQNCPRQLSDKVLAVHKNTVWFFTNFLKSRSKMKTALDLKKKQTTYVLLRAGNRIMHKVKIHRSFIPWNAQLLSMNIYEQTHVLTCQHY